MSACPTVRVSVHVFGVYNFSNSKSNTVNVNSLIAGHLGFVGLRQLHTRLKGLSEKIEKVCATPVLLFVTYLATHTPTPNCTTL